MFPFRLMWFPKLGTKVGRVTRKNYSRVVLQKPILRRDPVINSNNVIPALKPKMANRKILIAFDFDKTLIDANSDTYVLRLLPHGGKETHKYQNLQWTEYMQKVFDLLCAAGVKPADLFACLGEIAWTEGMKELLLELHSAGHDIIIISDCNTVFINTFLAANGVQHCFQRIFTNPAEFDSQGCLHISMYHEQDWCELSSVNLCKGHVLDEFIESKKRENFEYKFVAYVGDGSNDYCPMLRLTNSDLAFPRSGYPIHKQILGENRTQYHLKAKVIPWENGFQIRDSILANL